MPISVPYVFVNGTVADGTQVNADFAAVVAGVNASVTSGGALGTPSSGTLTNCTGLPISTGVSGLGTTVSTALGNAVNSASGVLQLDGSAQIPVTPEVGVSDNSNATTGNIGESVSSVVNSPGTTLTNNTPANVTSIPLTAGDWDVSGSVWISIGTTLATQLHGGTSTNSATLPAAPGNGMRYSLFSTFTASTLNALPLATTRFSSASPFTVFLIAAAAFAGGTTTAYGLIIARRAR